MLSNSYFIGDDFIIGSQGVEDPCKDQDDAESVDFGTPSRSKSISCENKFGRKLQDKLVNDSIHGHFKIPAFNFQIIDTPQFQRLRDLKQLGTSYFVFPGASHNRFEHCLGVGYLAEQCINRFRTLQPELNIDEREVKLVGIAGLCHDLGHGPFSHVFDNEFIPKARPGSSWHHEEMSVSLLRYLIDENSIDLDESDISLIGKLITGDRAGYSGNPFIFDIVSNSRNSVDVDKFDYLLRDCYNLHLKSTYDHNRLMSYSRVIGEEICFQAKEVFNIYELFHTRYTLFKQVYTHRAGKAIEYMICDALLAADSYLKLSDAVDDPERYTVLTDGIITEIERSHAPELAESRAILRRVRRRELYKLADEVLLSPEQANSIWTVISSEEIVSCQNHDGGEQLRPNDIIVHKLCIDYAMKERNPVDHIQFYNREDDSNCFRIPRHKVSLLIPSTFQEKVARIYCRDPSKVSAARAAFRNFLLRNHAAVTPKSDGGSDSSATSGIGTMRPKQKAFASLDTVPEKKGRKK